MNRLAWTLSAIIAAGAIALLLAACASLVTGRDNPTPKGEGQIAVSAYSQVDKAVLGITRLAKAKQADPSLPYTKQDLQNALDSAKAARAAVDAAQGSLATGDLSTAIGRLQFAQSLLQTISNFLAAPATMPVPPPPPPPSQPQQTQSETDHA